MTRKESEKDSERPHYYSQFWLDVAAGRRIIGAPRPNEEGEVAEPEIAESIAPRRAARSIEQDYNDRYPASDGREESIIHPVAEPLSVSEEFIEPEVEEEDQDLTNDAENLDYQDIPVEDTDIPDMDLGPVEEEEEDEEFYPEEEEEEDEDLNWGRGRKKAKPSRPTKPPLKKPGKRDTRRGF